MSAGKDSHPWAVYCENPPSFSWVEEGSQQWGTIIQVCSWHRHSKRSQNTPNRIKSWNYLYLLRFSLLLTNCEGSHSAFIYKFQYACTHERPISSKHVRVEGGVSFGGGGSATRRLDSGIIATTLRLWLPHASFDILRQFVFDRKNFIRGLSRPCMAVLQNSPFDRLSGPEVRGTATLLWQLHLHLSNEIAPLVTTRMTPCVAKFPVWSPVRTGNARNCNIIVAVAHAPQQRNCAPGYDTHDTMRCKIPRLIACPDRKCEELQHYCDSCTCTCTCTCGDSPMATPPMGELRQCGGGCGSVVGAAAGKLRQESCGRNMQINRIYTTVASYIC